MTSHDQPKLAELNFAAWYWNSTVDLVLKLHSSYNSMGHGQRIMANLRYISVPCQKLDCSGPSIVAKMFVSIGSCAMFMAIVSLFSQTRVELRRTSESMQK